MGLMTPTEAFDPDRDGGLGAMGPEPEEMDELSEPEPEEMGAEEAGAEAEAAEATQFDPVGEEKKKALEEIQKKIKEGKLKGKELDKALKELGFKPDDIKMLKDIQTKGKNPNRITKRNCKIGNRSCE